MGQTSPGVVSISGVKKTPDIITQVDLEEFLYLSRELEDAFERWVSKREKIRTALEGGATTEPGVHQAAMVNREDFRRLIVR